MGEKRYEPIKRAVHGWECIPHSKAESVTLSIIIESLEQRHAAASVNFKSLMINIKVMTNFGMEFLMAMFKQRQNFCNNQSTQALKAHDPEKKVVYMSASKIVLFSNFLLTNKGSLLGLVR